MADSIKNTTSQVNGLGEAISRNKKLLDQANVSASGFLSTLMKTGGIVFALREAVQLQKHINSMSVQKQLQPQHQAVADLQKRLVETRRLITRPGGFRENISEMQERLKSGGLTADQERELRQELADKREQSRGASLDIGDLTEQIKSAKQLAVLKDHEADLEEKLLKFANLRTLADAVLVKETVTRLYDFNKAVSQSNASFADRNKLFLIGNSIQISYGKSLADISQIFNVAQDRGFLFAASTDAARKNLGKLALGNVAASFKDYVVQATLAEQALGLSAEQVDALTAAAQRSHRPFEDLVETVASLNQNLGLTTGEAANLVEQVSEIANAFGLSGSSGLGALTETIGRLQAAAKSQGVTDPNFTANLTRQFADVSNPLGAQFGGQRILGDPTGAALKQSFASAGQFFEQFSHGPFGYVMLKQTAEAYGLTVDQAQYLIRQTKVMGKGFDAAAAAAHKQLEIQELANAQITQSGAIWGAFTLQLKALLFVALTPLTAVVKIITPWVTELNKGLRELIHTLPSSLKTVIKDITGIGSSLLILGVVIKSITSLAGLLRALWTGGIFKYLLSGVLPGVGGAAGKAAGSGVAAGLEKAAASSGALSAAQSLAAKGLGKLGTALEKVAVSRGIKTLLGEAASQTVANAGGSLLAKAAEFGARAAAAKLAGCGGAAAAEATAAGAGTAAAGLEKAAASSGALSAAQSLAAKGLGKLGVALEKVAAGPVLKKLIGETAAQAVGSAGSSLLAKALEFGAGAAAAKKLLGRGAAAAAEAGEAAAGAGTAAAVGGAAAAAEATAAGAGTAAAVGGAGLLATIGSMVAAFFTAPIVLAILAAGAVAAAVDLGAKHIIKKWADSRMAKDAAAVMVPKGVLERQKAVDDMMASTKNLIANNTGDNFRPGAEAALLSDQRSQIVDGLRSGKVTPKQAEQMERQTEELLKQQAAALAYNLGHALPGQSSSPEYKMTAELLKQITELLKQGNVIYKKETDSADKRARDHQKTIETATSKSEESDFSRRAAMQRALTMF